ETIAGLNVPTGIPLVYELDEDFKPVVKGRRYLDADAAAAAIAAVANQGKYPRPDLSTDADGADPRGDRRRRRLCCCRASGALGSRRAVLLAELTRDQVQHAAGDRDAVVAEALVVAAQERHVDRLLRGPGPVGSQEGRERVLVQGVEQVVVALDV